MPDLPKSLTETDEYRELNDKQRFNLSARLNYCNEIAEKASDASRSQAPDLIDLIDDIELDAYSIMSSGSPELDVSQWQIHSSWTFECRSGSMGDFVRPVMAQLLDQSIRLAATTDETAGAWLSQWSDAMRVCTVALEKSTKFQDAIAQLISINALVASFLTFSALFRLSRQ